MALENEGEDVGTRYYGTTIDDPMNFGYGSSGFGFDSDAFYQPTTISSDGQGASWTGFDWMENSSSTSPATFDASTGNRTITMDDGSTITIGPDGSPVGATESADAVGNSVAFNRALAWTNQNLGPTAARVFQNIMKNPGASLLTAMAAAKAFGGRDKEGGYNKPVPKMEVLAERPVYDDKNRRPGEAGRRYFTNPLFVAKGDTENMQKAYDATMQQKAALETAAPKYATPAPNPYAGKIPTNWNPKKTESSSTAGLPAIPTKLTEEGGIPMAEGGLASAGRYLQGKTDGMADKIPSSIDGEQPAALSHGEFVIPADVVSHLGNGNSDAGAQKLYEMMDRIRKARTGTTKQGKQINPDEFTMGGLAAAYAGGGEVRGFSGATGSAVTTTNTTTAGGGIPHDTSKTSTLSPWVGDYVTEALGEGAALANAPYQAYKGPLTAGESELQKQAFAGASDIAASGYTPGTFVGSFGAEQATQYMNPYLQASLDPQLKELKRQSDIARLDDAARLTRAGAFGGSRQAIMESEGRRNLLDKQIKVLGEGYKSAFDTGASRFAADQAAQERSRQFGADFGLKSVAQLADLGATQRGITAEGIAADKKQFEDERDWAYKMPQYKLGLLAGLPIGASTSSVNPDALAKLQSDISGLGALYKNLEKLLPPG